MASTSDMLLCCFSLTCSEFQIIRNNKFIVLIMAENSINHLKSLLGSFDANSKLPEITNIFEKVAIELFNKFHIQKGDQEYYFSNLEFYFCNQYHLDIITYPRQLPKGKWFFHQSGFDFTFDSKYDIVTMFADANERNRHIRHRSRGLRAPCREAPPRCFS